MVIDTGMTIRHRNHQHAETDMLTKRLLGYIRLALCLCSGTIPEQVPEVSNHAFQPVAEGLHDIAHRR
jgi:hypothetical protein